MPVAGVVNIITRTPEEGFELETNQGGYDEGDGLGRFGMPRRIRVRCQQHVAASEIVSRSDLLATMSRSQAELANLQAENRVLPFPAGIPPLETFLYWHAARNNQDGGAASAPELIQPLRPDVQSPRPAGWRHG